MADPRRADQPPRRRRARGADPGAQRLFGRGGDRQPRSPHARDDRRPAGAGRRRHREGIRRLARRLHRVRAFEGFGAQGIEERSQGSPPPGGRSARQGVALRKRAMEAESDLAKLTEQRSAVDRAMFDPSTADATLAKLTMSETDEARRPSSTARSRPPRRHGWRRARRWRRWRLRIGFGAAGTCTRALPSSPLRRRMPPVDPGQPSAFRDDGIEDRPYPLTNASRSGLMTSAWVVHIPCGSPHRP